MEKYVNLIIPRVFILLGILRNYSPYEIWKDLVLEEV